MLAHVVSSPELPARACPVVQREAARQRMTLKQRILHGSWLPFCIARRSGNHHTPQPMTHTVVLADLTLPGTF